MLVESELFFQAIIKPVMVRFANDPYRLSSDELDLLNWYSDKFDHRLELELLELDKILYSNSEITHLKKINFSDEK